MTGPLALPAAPEREPDEPLLPHVVGPWPQITDAIRAELWSLLREVAWRYAAPMSDDSEPWPLILTDGDVWTFATIPGPEPARWARVRVSLSVEVLDGIP